MEIQPLEPTRNKIRLLTILSLASEAAPIPLSILLFLPCILCPHLNPQPHLPAPDHDIQAFANAIESHWPHFNKFVSKEC